MFRFLREVLASTTGFLLALVLLGFIFLSDFGDITPAEVPDETVLVLNCSLAFADNPTPPALTDAVLGGNAQSPIPLARVRHALQAARRDDRISGLELTGVVSFTGWAMLEELRREIVRFKDSGKPVMADFDYYDEAALFLASAADSVYLPPLGEVEWNGFSIEVEYLARALEKAGVEMQVTRVGKYKSAVEPYLDERMSEENRAQLAAILRQREALVTQTVGEARGIDPEALQAAFSTMGLLSADEAIELGLVDGVRYWDETAAEFREWTNDAEPGEGEDFWYSSVSLDEYLRDPIAAEDDFAAGATVAVVYAEGEIVDDGVPGQVVGHEVAAQLSELRLDPDVAAVVLRVQSPGGSASASEVILREVGLLAMEKPMIVSMGDVAASGGYWISAYANEIYAEPTTITGSIGVFGMFPNLAQLADRLGVDMETVTTGPHASMGSMFLSMSDETLARVQASVDRVYDDFLERVAEGRDMEVAAVHEIAQGRVWVGTEALSLGLVDKIGSLPDAIQRAADLAGLKEGYAVAHLFYVPDEWERLFNDLLQQADVQLAPTALGQLSARTQRTLELMEPRRNPSRIWARLPYVALR